MVLRWQDLGNFHFLRWVGLFLFGPKELAHVVVLGAAVVFALGFELDAARQDQGSLPSGALAQTLLVSLHAHLFLRRLRSLNGLLLFLMRHQNTIN